MRSGCLANQSARAQVSFTRPPSFHHPNVYGDEDCFICLDMLRRYEKAEPNKGWTSAYTVQSVLLQLQSFLIGARDVDQDYGGSAKVRWAEQAWLAHRSQEDQCSPKRILSHPDPQYVEIKKHQIRDVEVCICLGRRRNYSV